MRIRRNTGRLFARIISSSDFSGRSSVAPTRWRRLFATKGVVYYCSMRSFAVCTLTNSRCPLHPPSNQTPKLYTTLDKLPLLPLYTTFGMASEQQVVMDRTWRYHSPIFTSFQK